MRNIAGKQMDIVASMPREMLVFRVAWQEFCVEVSCVKEVRGATPTAMLPNSPPYLLGVINLRGAIVPIVNVAARLNFPVTIPKEQPVIVVVLVGAKQVGLLVDEVCDIVEVTEDVLQPTPQLGCETMQELVKALVRADGRTIGVLAPDCMLPQSEDT